MSWVRNTGRRLAAALEADFGPAFPDGGYTGAPPVNGGTLYDHPRNVPQAVGRITFGPRVDAGRLARHSGEGDNDNLSSPVAAQAQPVGVIDYANPIARLRNAGGFIYLGSPYSLYPDHDEAAEIVAAAAAGLMAQGIVVYSPIAHGHYVSQQGDLPASWEFWKAQCQPLIDAASALAVLKMEGWGQSVGLQYEIGEFMRAGKPVVFLDSEAGWREPAMDPVEARHDREASRADWEYQFRKEQEAA